MSLWRLGLFSHNLWDTCGLVLPWLPYGIGLKTMHQQSIFLMLPVFELDFMEHWE